MRNSTPFLILLAGIVALVGCPVAIYGSQDDVTFTVQEKERVTQSSSEGVNSKYLVYTETETFEITDSILFARFNSSDVYGQLRPNRSYRARVAGWRVPLFSMYRNIISVTPTTTVRG